MRLRSLLLTCACVLFTIVSASADPIYRWIDKGGQVHYSSTPPPAATGTQAERVNIAAPQAVSMVAPVVPQLTQKSRSQRPSAQDKATDQQIRDTWGKFKDALGECQGIGQQLDDLRNDVSPNPVTHTKLTAAQRDVLERDLEEKQKKECPEDGG